MVDPVRFFPFTGDAVLGALLGTEETPRAFLCVNGIGDQRAAYPGRASFIPNMGDVLVVEIVHGGQKWVSGSTAQGAE
jgi:hypothetical protein